VSKRKPQGLHSFKAKNGTVYYSCLHPETGKRHSLGKDFVIACKVLHSLQAQYRTDREQKILNRINGSSKTFATFIETKYLPMVEASDIKPNTRKEKLYYANMLVKQFGDKPLTEVSTRLISDFMDFYVEQGKARTAQGIRTILIDIFSLAISKGWIPATHNPAKITRAPKVNTQRARLTIEQFKLIYAQCTEEWERRMMELAILTSHAGISDLASMQKPKEGFLWIRRTKTDEGVKIPLELTLEVLGWNLGDTVRKCTSTKILSPYLLHHTQDHGGAKRGQKMSAVRLSNAFTALVRKSGIDWEDKQPATLYEVRSLSERLYSGQGINTQTLLAHKSAKSTDGYHDTRGDDWHTLNLKSTSLDTKDLQKPYNGKAID
jgi:integrase